MKKESKLHFYDSFVCTASDCPFTCCQEWAIGVDDRTYACWQKKLKLNVAATVTTNESGSGYKIALNDKRECPYLTKEHLCSLVLRYGDSVLSDTCAGFPREIHAFSNRIEKTLVSCCPEVVDFLNREKVQIVGEADFSWGNTEEEQDEKLLYDLRRDMMRLLGDEGYSLLLAYQMIFYIQLDAMRHYYEDGEWIYERDQYFHGKILEEMSQTIRNLPVDRRATLQERNELFLDLVANYREQGMYTRALQPVLMQAEALESLLESSEKTEAIEHLLLSYGKFEEELSAYTGLFRNFLVAELFTNLVKPLSDMESVTVMLQWIGMEWAGMMHVLFLQWLADGQKLSYEEIREWIVLISRMMGYDEDDIFEYMENCFEDLIWEWGYLHLLLP